MQTTQRVNRRCGGFEGGALGDGGVGRARGEEGGFGAIAGIGLDVRIAHDGGRSLLFGGSAVQGFAGKNSGEGVMGLRREQRKRRGNGFGGCGRMVLSEDLGIGSSSAEQEDERTKDIKTMEQWYCAMNRANEDEDTVGRKRAYITD